VASSEKPASASAYAPDDREAEPWDVIVVGTGMGGSTVGHALARLGRRVLFIERGMFLFGGADRGDGRLATDPDERPEARMRRGWWPLAIEGKTNSGKMEFFAPLGCGSGGTTNLYAAQLERLAPSDFRPRASHPDVADSTLPESWPISYEELVPYYRRAEELFRVRGTPDPLNPDPGAKLIEPPPLSARDQAFFDSFRELGLNPYRAHVGYEFIPGCEECGGTMCPRACKNDAGRICLMPALERHGARILSECEVLGLSADATRVTSVRCRKDGREFSIAGKIVVLAAGAYRTPILLLNSTSAAWPAGLANRSGAVGRNLMVHAGDFVAVRAKRKLSIVGPKKAISLNDFYLSQGRKLGTFQSVGISVEWGYILYFLRTKFAKGAGSWRKLTNPFLRMVAHAAAFHFRNAAMFATIVEDLPYWENRVLPDPQSKNGMRFEYSYPAELRERNLLFRKRLAAALAPRHRILVLSGQNSLNFGHVYGTCRFGTDPATSVLDKHNRAHDVENLYVVDASFFPSSGGMNPTLTIAANALRVADAIDRRLEATPKSA
jgi:choline dehydrogenase-like flavoprotein